MPEVLTCAISETQNTNKFKIIYYNLDKKQFEEKEIPKEQFRNSHGDIVWDLFHVTQIAENGNASLRRAYSIDQVLSFFEQQRIPAKRFFKLEPKYAIVKVDAIHEVQQPYRKGNRIKARLDFISGGDRYTGQLNKDFRWINYWHRSPEDEWANKCNVWKNYLNNPDYEVYAVMHTYQFPRNRQQWIAGFHCLNKDSLKGV